MQQAKFLVFFSIGSKLLNQFVSRGKQQVSERMIHRRPETKHKTQQIALTIVQSAPPLRLLYSGSPLG